MWMLQTNAVNSCWCTPKHWQKSALTLSIAVTSVRQSLSVNKPLVSKYLLISNIYFKFLSRAVLVFGACCNFTRRACHKNTSETRQNATGSCHGDAAAFLTIFGLVVKLTIWTYFCPNLQNMQINKELKMRFWETSPVTLILAVMTFKRNHFMVQLLPIVARVLLKSLHWFRICCIHKIPPVITSWPWPLNQWPSQCHQCHVHLLLINCVTSFIKISVYWGCKDEWVDGQIHVHPDNPVVKSLLTLSAPAGSNCWCSKG